MIVREVDPMPTAAKRKPSLARKGASNKAKTRTKGLKKYGRYNSYKEYSESIILQPMRELADILEQKTNQR